MLLRYADLVESLHGTYVTAADMNTGQEDMDVVGERTSHVLGRTVGIRDRDAALLGDPAVVLHDPERIERPVERRAGVDRPDRRHHGREHLGPLQVALGEWFRFDPRRDQAVEVGQVRDDLRTDPGRRGRADGLLFGAAVDAEQVGVLARQPQEERLAVGDHPEVAIRPPLRDRLDRELGAGPRRDRAERGVERGVGRGVGLHGGER